MREQRGREELLAFFREQSAFGNKCYISNTDSMEAYGFIVLEDCVMDISLDRFEGWKYSLNYVPSHGCGSGCRCNDLKTFDLSYETLIRHKVACQQYARTLGAKLYSSPSAGEKHILEMYKSSNYTLVE